jgi:hypothetical protein
MAIVSEKKDEIGWGISIHWRDKQYVKNFCRNNGREEDPLGELCIGEGAALR